MLKTNEETHLIKVIYSKRINKNRIERIQINGENIQYLYEVDRIFCKNLDIKDADWKNALNKRGWMLNDNRGGSPYVLFRETKGMESIVDCMAFTKAYEDVRNSLTSEFYTIDGVLGYDDSSPLEFPYHAMNGIPVTIENFLREVERKVKKIKDDEKKKFDSIKIVKSILTTNTREEESFLKLKSYLSVKNYNLVLLEVGGNLLYPLHEDFPD